MYCSAEFATYHNYVRSLRFEEKPDYAYLRQLIRNLFYRQGFTYDYVFDWNTLKDDKDPTGMSFSSSPEAEVVSKKKKEPKDCTSPIEIPTAGAATTAGATSAVAVTVKAQTELQNKHITEGEVLVSPGDCSVVGQSAQPACVAGPPPQIINSPPAFHLDHNVNYGCTPIPSPRAEYNSLLPPQLLSPPQQQQQQPQLASSNNSVKQLQVL